METEMYKMLKAAQDAGLCWTQKELAEMAGVDISIMSGCINGKRPNKTADAKVRSLLISKNITIDADYSNNSGSINMPIKSPNSCNVNPSEDLQYIITSLRGELEEQRQSYERIIQIIVGAKNEK